MTSAEVIAPGTKPRSTLNQVAAAVPMSAVDPLDVVLARLEPFGLRTNGTDRWRACCPGHNGSNPSALSIGRADNGAVLLCCHQGCTVEVIVHGLGLRVGDLFPPRGQTTPGAGTSPLRRRRMLSAQQALDLLVRESMVIFVIASDVHQQRAITDDAWQRLRTAVARVQALAAESRA